MTGDRTTKNSNSGHEDHDDAEVWGKASPFAPGPTENENTDKSDKSDTTERGGGEVWGKASPFAPSTDTEKLDKIEREDRDKDEDEIWKNSPFGPSRKTVEAYAETKRAWHREGR